MLDNPYRNKVTAALETWNRPEVRAARATRDPVRVTVNGITTVYTSTGRAFKSLHLPENRAQFFRLDLKRERRATFTHDGRDYHFAIITKEEFERAEALEFGLA